MEYLHQEWSPKRRTWEPAGEEPARYPWRRVLADRRKPVPVVYHRPRPSTVGGLGEEAKARHMAAWLVKSGATVCHVFPATRYHGSFNYWLQRELQRLKWHVEFKYCDPAAWQGPPVDLGPECPATVREESQSCLM